MERYDEVEDHDSNRDDPYGEASTAERVRKGKKTFSSRVSPSHAIIGCLMFLAALAFILLSDGTPLTASARPSEHEIEPAANANLEFYHSGHMWNKAAYAQKTAFCERLAESLPNFGHDANYYCRFLNKVFHTTDKLVLKCTLTEAILIGLPAD